MPPFPFKNIEEQVCAALAATDDRHAFAGQIGVAQHHFAGVETAIALRRHAIRQLYFLANTDTYVPGVEDLIRGGHHELALPIVKFDPLNVLIECQ